MKQGILTVFSLAGSALAHALGGWDAALQVLLSLMAADYLSGLLLAAIWKKSPKSDNGALCSRAGFRGLCKKGLVPLLVFVGVRLDAALGSDYCHNAIVLFFAGNEGLSLLENLGLMGIRYPAFLQNALEVLKNRGDAGRETIEPPEQKP